MKKSSLVVASLLLSVGCGDPPPPQPPPPPPPAPMPVAAPPPAPVAAPARDERRENILRTLDQIDAHAQKIEEAHASGHHKAGHHDDPNSPLNRSHEVDRLVISIAEPISHYSAATAHYAELAVHTKKMHVALTAKKSKDAHHHAGGVRKSVADTKADL